MRRSRRWWLFASLLLVLVLLGAVIWFATAPSGIAVVVENQTGEELRDLTLITPLRSRNIAGIEPGQAATVRVALEEVARIEVKYRLRDGSRLSIMTERDISELGPYRVVSIQLGRNSGGIGIEDTGPRRLLKQIRQHLGL